MFVWHIQKPCVYVYILVTKDYNLGYFVRNTLSYYMEISRHILVAHIDMELSVSVPRAAHKCHLLQIKIILQ